MPIIDINDKASKIPPISKININRLVQDTDEVFKLYSKGHIQWARHSLEMRMVLRRILAEVCVQALKQPDVNVIETATTTIDNHIGLIQKELL